MPSISNWRRCRGPVVRRTGWMTRFAQRLWNNVSRSWFYGLLRSAATRVRNLFLIPGPLGIIERILPDQPDIHPTAYVKRDDSLRARLGLAGLCRPATSSGRVQERRSGSSFPIGRLRLSILMIRYSFPPCRLRHLIFTFLRELAGADGEIARQIVVGRIGATRSLDAPNPPITIQPGRARASVGG